MTGKIEFGSSFAVYLNLSLTDSLTTGGWDVAVPIASSVLVTSFRSTLLSGDLCNKCTCQDDGDELN